MKKILVVDDNSNDRKILKIILARQGFEVIEARDGVEGLETALSRNPDIIISDALMPRMDGFQLLREVKKDQRLKSIPFIFYSAVYTGYKEAQLALFLGADAFIDRPKEPEEFWNELTLALEEHARGAAKKVSAAQLLEEDEEFLRKYSQIVAKKLVETVAELRTALAERELSEAALRQSEERLRLTALAANIGTYDINIETGELFRSPELVAMLGLPTGAPSRISLDEAWKFVHPGDLAHVKEAYEASLDPSGSGILQEEHRIVRADGQVRWFLTRGRTFFEEAGGNRRPLRTMGVYLDLTERKRSEQALRESEERFLKIASTALDAVILMDNDGNVSFWNDAATRMFGYTNEEILGKDLHARIMPERSIDAFRRGFEKFRTTGEGSLVGKVYEIDAKRKDGTEFPVEIALAPLQLKGTWNAIGIVRDITERKRLEEEITHMSHHDSLTGLPNRRLLREVIDVEREQAKRNGKKLCILFLDLDRFKEINDILGHEAGDLLIKEAASRLKSHTRKSDTIARIGGDEFNIILTDIGRPEDSADIARNIVGAFRKPFLVAGHELHATASIGISIYPDDSEDIDTLMRYADIALYQTKQSGRNNYQYYDPSINVRSLERIRLENMLQRSLDLDEMVIHYQPLVNISSGRIVCAEALTRWRHPEKGLLLPDDFIPAAEETGFINALGEWSLRTASRQVKAWLDAGLSPVCVTVNLSARQFQDPALAGKISSILTETQLPPGCLDIEVTESTAMSNIERTATLLHELREMGVHISIDDFGTGYSSLNHLKKMPIERIKIDKSFVQDIAFDPDDRTIISAVTSMARKMGIKTVAEGVETEEQLSFLRDSECDEAQGFLFSKPLTAEAFGELIKARR